MAVDERKDDGIHFGRTVGVRTGEVAGPRTSGIHLNMTMLAAIKSVLVVHGELPKDDNGVATVTIRQLIEKFSPQIDGILREYVCAFGKHGLAVLERYIANALSQCTDQAIADAWYADFESVVLDSTTAIRKALANS